MKHFRPQKIRRPCSHVKLVRVCWRRTLGKSELLPPIDFASRKLNERIAGRWEVRSISSYGCCCRLELRKFDLWGRCNLIHCVDAHTHTAVDPLSNKALAHSLSWWIKTIVFHLPLSHYMGCVNISSQALQSPEPPLINIQPKIQSSSRSPLSQMKINFHLYAHWRFMGT